MASLLGSLGERPDLGKSIKLRATLITQGCGFCPSTGYHNMVCQIASHFPVMNCWSLGINRRRFYSTCLPQAVTPSIHALRKVISKGASHPADRALCKVALKILLHPQKSGQCCTPLLPSTDYALSFSPIKPALYAVHGYNHPAKNKTSFKKGTRNKPSTSAKSCTAVQRVPLLFCVRAGIAVCELAQFNDTKPVKICSTFGILPLKK